jgi:uncharacterized membrane protein YciS (DUF1049 family)
LSSSLCSLLHSPVTSSHSPLIHVVFCSGFSCYVILCSKSWIWQRLRKTLEKGRIVNKKDGSSSVVVAEGGHITWRVTGAYRAVAWCV